MTAITVASDIPNNINTLERLILHNARCLENVIGGATFNLDGGPNARNPYVTIVSSPARGDGLDYTAIYIFLPMDPTFRSGTARPWMYANEISNNAYPAAFRAT
jgi:hypothetical protein